MILKCCRETSSSDKHQSNKKPGVYRRGEPEVQMLRYIRPTRSTRPTRGLPPRGVRSSSPHPRGGFSAGPRKNGDTPAKVARVVHASRYMDEHPIRGMKHQDGPTRGWFRNRCSVEVTTEAAGEHEADTDFIPVADWDPDPREKILPAVVHPSRKRLDHLRYSRGILHSVRPRTKHLSRYTGRLPACRTYDWVSLVKPRFRSDSSGRNRDRFSTSIFIYPGRSWVT